MPRTIYVPRVFGGTIILTVAPPVLAQPGIATLSDGLHGAASISDVLVDRATAGDVEVGSVTISDQA